MGVVGCASTLLELGSAVGSAGRDVVRSGAVGDCCVDSTGGAGCTVGSLTRDVVSRDAIGDCCVDSISGCSTVVNQARCGVSNGGSVTIGGDCSVIYGCVSSDVNNVCSNVVGESPGSTGGGSIVSDVVEPIDVLCNIRDAQERDSQLKVIICGITKRENKPLWDDVAGLSGVSKALWSQWDRLEVVDGILYRQYYCVRADVVVRQVIIPRALREEFVRTLHAGVGVSHLGRTRTEETIRQRAYWVGWSTDVRRMLEACT